MGGVRVIVQWRRILPGRGAAVDVARAGAGVVLEGWEGRGYICGREGGSGTNILSTENGSSTATQIHIATIAGQTRNLLSA